MKSFKYIFLSALNAIRINSARSFLTVLGIVIGVSSIIVIMSLGDGAQRLILGEISQMGAETVVVLPGEATDATAAFSDSLTDRDLAALQVTANVPNLEAIMPAVMVPGRISYRGDNYSPGAMLGAEADFFGSTFDVYPEEGNIFTDSDVENQARVIILGSEVKDELFGASDAVGQNVSIADTQFRVIGVYPPTGQRSVFDIDNLALIPYTTAQTYITGSSHFQRIIIRGDSAENVDKLAFDVEMTLRESHGLYPGDDADFSVMTQQGLIDQISIVLNILTYFLISVVAIALVVGGIGVMNIMLVSVTERTKEIGLRKALGATRRAILQQFLLEAMALTLIGGLIGVALGSLLAFGASFALTELLGVDWRFAFPTEGAILAVGVSVFVGLVFGLYPAKKAADKSPIEALRYE